MQSYQMHIEASHRRPLPSVFPGPHLLMWKRLYHSQETCSFGALSSFPKASRITGASAGPASWTRLFSGS